MNREIAVAAGAVPATLFVLANIGASTVQIAGNQAAAREAITVASVSMLIAAAATGSVATTLTVGLAVAAALFAMHKVWPSAVADFIHGERA